MSEHVGDAGAGVAAIDGPGCAVCGTPLRARVGDLDLSCCGGPTGQRLETMVAAIAAHRGCPLRVAGLSALTGWSGHELNVACQRHLRINTVELIRNITLDRARLAFVAAGPVPVRGEVGRIAAATGFGSARYLTRCYVNHFGETPTDTMRRPATPFDVLASMPGPHLTRGEVPIPCPAPLLYISPSVIAGMPDGAGVPAGQDLPDAMSTGDADGAGRRSVLLMRLFRLAHFFSSGPFDDPGDPHLVELGAATMLVAHPLVQVICDGERFCWPLAGGGEAAFEVGQLDHAASALAIRLSSAATHAGATTAILAAAVLRSLNGLGAGALRGRPFDPVLTSLAVAVVGLTGVHLEMLASPSDTTALARHAFWLSTYGFTPATGRENPICVPQ